MPLLIQHCPMNDPAGYTSWRCEELPRAPVGLQLSHILRPPLYRMRNVRHPAGSLRSASRRMPLLHELREPGIASKRVKNGAFQLSCFCLLSRCSVRARNASCLPPPWHMLPFNPVSRPVSNLWCIRKRPLDTWYKHRDCEQRREGRWRMNSKASQQQRERSLLNGKTIFQLAANVSDQR